MRISRVWSLTVLLSPTFICLLSGRGFAIAIQRDSVAEAMDEVRQQAGSLQLRAIERLLARDLQAVTSTYSHWPLSTALSMPTINTKTVDVAAKLSTSLHQQSASSFDSCHQLRPILRSPLRSVAGKRLPAPSLSSAVDEQDHPPASDGSVVREITELRSLDPRSLSLGLESRAVIPYEVTCHPVNPLQHTAFPYALAFVVGFDPTLFDHDPDVLCGTGFGVGCRCDAEPHWLDCRYPAARADLYSLILNSSFRNWCYNRCRCVPVDQMAESDTYADILVAVHLELLKENARARLSLEEARRISALYRARGPQLD